MTEDQLNPELLSLWRATMQARNANSVGNFFLNNNGAVTEELSSHSSLHDKHEHLSQLSNSFAVPEKAPSSMLRRISTSRAEPVDLTLEEIFRDHNLKESSHTLESSMDSFADDTGSDLSCIFDDDEEDSVPPQPRIKEQPSTTARLNPISDVATCLELKSNVDPNDLDAQQRFKPFHEEKWNVRLKELMKYRQEYGDCLVPHTFAKNPQLARWVKRQRRQHKLMIEGRASTMTKERLDILNNVGFTWDSHDAAWQEKLSELNRYRKEVGNCLVPSNYKKSPQLATWVKCQRRQYKLYWEGRSSAMTPDRIIQLEKIGFEWEIRSSGHVGLARSDYLYLSEAISKIS